MDSQRQMNIQNPHLVLRVYLAGLGPRRRHVQHEKVCEKDHGMEFLMDHERAFLKDHGKVSLTDHAVVFLTDHG